MAEKKLDALERAVLGLFLRDMGVFWQVKERVKPELFFNGRHQRIISVMHKLADAGAASFEFSLISMRINAEADADFDIRGYLYLMSEDAGDPSDIIEMLVTMEEQYISRQLHDLSQWALKASKIEAEKSMQEKLDEGRRRLESFGDRLGAQAISAGRFGERLRDKVGDSIRKGTVIGLRGGLSATDNLTGAFMPGKVYVLAGPPGSGKSSICWQWALNFAKTAPGIFFSQEMPGEELLARHLAGMTGIRAGRIESASVNIAEYEQISEAVDQLADLQIYIDEENGLNHVQVRNRAYRQRRLRGCKWLCLDHLMHMGRTAPRQSDLERISENTKGLKKLAKDMEIPVILLAQLTKEYGYGDWRKVRMPQRSDILGGSAVEQDADVILMTHRPYAALLGREPAPSSTEDEKAAYKTELHRWIDTVDDDLTLAQFANGKFRGGKPSRPTQAWFKGSTTSFHDTQPRATFQAPELEFT